MTKTIVIGNEPKEPKKIEFKKLLTEDGKLKNASVEPCLCAYIELVCKNYGSYDLMYAYHNPETRNGILYLGYWNDGIV